MGHAQWAGMEAGGANAAMGESTMRVGLALFATGVLLAGASAAAGKSEPAATAHPPRWELALAGADSGTLVIEGRVLGVDGKPARDLRVHVYHADRHGNYSAGPGGEMFHSGLLRTNVLGQFRVFTDLPGMAEGSPHVHFEVELPGRRYRVIPLNLARPAGAGSDTRYGRLPWMVSLSDTIFWAYVTPRSGGSYRCRWDLRLDRASTIATHPEAFDTR